MSGSIDRRRFLLLAPALGLAAVSRAAPPASLPLAKDLRADGQAARARKIPILVLFSLPGCPYCEIVRRSHLVPMLRDPQTAGLAVFRQIDIGGEHAVLDFAGRRTTHEAIARAHGMRSAPVVAFWDGDGRPVAENLAGMLLPDFYSAYLEAALETARARVATAR